MKTLDKTTLMSWEQCYSEKRIDEILNGRTELTALEILDLDIPLEDRCYVLFYNNHFFSDRDMRLIAASIAESVLHYFEKVYPDDNRPREAIKAARLYALDEISREELGIARDAARDAAGDAARDAAGDAWDAAWDAGGNKVIEIIKTYIINSEEE